MFAISPGTALLAAAALLALVSLGARVGPARIAMGVGAFRAVILGAVALALLGVAVGERTSALRAAEPGLELASWGEQGVVWVLVVPFLAFGMAIVAVAIRQVLRRKVYGAAGWVGVVVLIAAGGLAEATGRLWLDPDEGRLHLRRGLFFVREDEAATNAVDAVELVDARVRGAEVTQVRLAGRGLEPTFSTEGYQSADAHLARVEAERWGQLGGWSVRERASGEEER